MTTSGQFLNVINGALAPGTTSTTGTLNTNSVDFESSSDTYSVQLNGMAAGQFDQLNVTGTVTLQGTLNVALGYTPTVGSTFTIINNDGTDAVSGTFANLPEGGLLTVGNIVFRISYVGGTGNDVTLTRVSADIWNGGGVNSNWMTSANWTSGVAPAIGDSLIFPTGGSQLTGVNNYPTGTAFGSILISGDNYNLSGNQILLSGAITAQGVSESLGMGLKLASNGGIASATASTLTVTGAIDLNGHTLSVSESNISGTIQLNGAISNAGNLTTGGSGQTILGTANSYTGVTTINAGTLIVSNSQGLGTGDNTAATGVVMTGGLLQLQNTITIANKQLSGSVQLQRNA